jgi:hypothetical protein
MNWDPWEVKIPLNVFCRCLTRWSDIVLPFVQFGVNMVTDFSLDFVEGEVQFLLQRKAHDIEY